MTQMLSVLHFWSKHSISSRVAHPEAAASLAAFSSDIALPCKLPLDPILLTPPESLKIGLEECKKTSLLLTAALETALSILGASLQPAISCKIEAPCGETQYTLYLADMS